MKKTTLSAGADRRSDSGQVLTEFAVLAVIFSIVALSAAVLLKQFSVYGRWLLNVVGVGCP